MTSQLTSHAPASQVLISQVRDRAKAALQLTYVADALSMPVHWYYNTQDIFNTFPGGIQKFEDAPAKHPMSFLSLPETNGKQIVGDVILKDKRKFWGIQNQHVHQGMKAGENTLNAHCARLVTRTLVEGAGHYNADTFLDNYIAFMTEDSPQHPDTYAESYHRGFFTNLEAGLPRNKCGLAAQSTASVGGLVTIAPIALAELLNNRDLERVQKICREHLYLTHPDEKLAKICDSYVELIDSLLFRDEGSDPKSLIAKAASSSVDLDVKKLYEKNLADNAVVGETFSKACSIEDSWPSLVYLAYKYNSQPKAALLANTNVGGENCHRGSVLGVIVGLSSADGVDDLFIQLTDAEHIKKEINSLLAFALD